RLKGIYYRHLISGRRLVGMRVPLRRFPYHHFLPTLRAVSLLTRQALTLLCAVTVACMFIREMMTVLLSTYHLFLLFLLLFIMWSFTPLERFCLPDLAPLYIYFPVLAIHSLPLEVSACLV